MYIYIYLCSAKGASPFLYMWKYTDTCQKGKNKHASFGTCLKKGENQKNMTDLWFRFFFWSDHFFLVIQNPTKNFQPARKK